MNYYYRSIASEEMSDYESFYKRISELLPDEAWICELGIADGRGVIMMAALMKECQKRCNIIGVDNWDYGGNAQRNTVLQNVIRSNEDNIKIWDCSSLDASCRAGEEQFDFVFIDSSHTYEGTKAEIRLWIHKVKSNGILAGHDFVYSADVKRAVEELIPQQYIQQFDTTYNLGVWYIEKDENFKLLK